MRRPQRRVLSFFQTIPSPGKAKVELVCGHEFWLELVKDIYDQIPLPKMLPCPECPMVPDHREHAYVAGGAIPALRSVS